MVVKTDVTKIRMSDWYSIVVEYIYKLFKVVTEVGLEGVKLLENLLIKNHSGKNTRLYGCYCINNIFVSLARHLR